MADAVGYEIRETRTVDGGVVLTLEVEDSVVVRASVERDVLSKIQKRFGLDEEAVIADLRQSLLRALKTQGQFVTLSALQDDETQRLKFHARFTYRLRDEISTGVVWYDVITSTTGPEGTPAVVCNQLRFEVHRKLTSEDSIARQILERRR